MKKQKKNTPKKKSTLAIVGSLLLLSAGFRIATDAGQVIASESLKSLTDSSANANSITDLARPERMESVLKIIQEREAKLEKREAEIAVREEEIAEAERTISEELEKLETAEKRLRKTITMASEAAEKDVAQLTQVYADMKPKQAAALFEQMEPGFAAGFLGRMPTDSAARIMANMTPEKAYVVSVDLAGRNADIPME
ncbi:MotE family protein [Marivita sp. S0852]|uniref:MotE family protein n=1 Tax=Marivita sp. S0852 TaxID=3373893 RepID=UPI003981C08E